MQEKTGANEALVWLMMLDSWFGIRTSCFTETGIVDPTENAHRSRD